jgi:hypothetical protein
METIRQAARVIEQEFDEPLRDVVEGFMQMGYSMPYIAEVLNVSVSSVKHFCVRAGLRRSGYPPIHREIPGRPRRDSWARSG